MKDSPLKVLAVKVIFLSMFGLSTLPFLSVVVQYIDAMTGFSSGNGYHTNPLDYIFETPLLYMGIVLCMNIILSISYLIYSFFIIKK